MKIRFVTSNTRKLAVARNALKGYGIKVEQVNLETPEIQTTSTVEVAKYSAKYAAEKLKRPVIKGDVGFAIEALNNFPGRWLNSSMRVFLSSNLSVSIKTKRTSALSLLML